MLKRDTSQQQQKGYSHAQQGRHFTTNNREDTVTPSREDTSRPVAKRIESRVSKEDTSRPAAERIRPQLS